MAKIFTKDNYQLTVQDLIDLLEQIPNKNSPVYRADGDGLCDAYPYLDGETCHIWTNEGLGFVYCSTEDGDQPCKNEDGEIHKEYIVLD